MRFIETSSFTHEIARLLDDDAYWAMQVALGLNPHLGRLIRGTGGLRKLRWSLSASGKRGGVRVLYFWHEASESFYMLHVYRKNEQEDLTPTQVRVLKRLVDEEFR